MADLGLRHALLGYRDNDIGFLLENVVFLELKHRGYNIYVRKVADKEIDFIAELGGKRMYIQVAYSLATKEVIDREFNTLLEIKDNFSKFVLSLDDTFGEDIQGIRWMNIRDFLLNKSL